MITVIFYNLILFLSTFFVWLSEKGRGNTEKYFFLFCAFLIVFIPSAIRYDIGTDYLNYLDIYNNEWFENYKYKEPLFYFINFFLKELGAHFQWLFVVFAFIFTFVVFTAYPRKGAWLLHFLFFATLFYFSFNVVRQAIGLCWALLAIFYFFEKRYFLFFMFIGIGSAFHQSIIFIAIAGLCALIPLNIHLKTRVIPIFFIGFIVFTFLSMNYVLTYIEQILNLLGFAQYANYFQNKTHFIARNFGTGLGVLVKLCFSIYIILNAKQFVVINKNYWLLIILIFIYAISLVLASNIIIFGRMADTFVIATIIGAYLLFLLPQNRQINRLVLLLFMAFLCMAYIYSGFGIENSYANPKRNPYQTIFKDIE